MTEKLTLKEQNALHQRAFKLKKKEFDIFVGFTESGKLQLLQILEIIWMKEFGIKESAFSMR